MEGVVLKGAWILFYSLLYLLHQSLLNGTGWEALISEPAFPSVRWLQMLTCTYVWECCYRHQGADQAGCPPKCMKISSVCHADKYEHTLQGMQRLAPLACDSQDLCKPEMKEFLTSRSQFSLS